jgi:uncharacterized protein
MTFSLYDAIIPSNMQILTSVSSLLDKAEAYCTEKNIDAETLIQAKLAQDMFSFAYQVKAVAEHSMGAIEGVRKGVFSPDTSMPPATFAALKQYLADAQAGLGQVTPDEVNSFMGRDMRFEFAMRNYLINFTAENFLLSFSQPNFYFHATTAYGILRMKGVAVGKMDFMGPMRAKV